MLTKLYDFGEFGPNLKDRGGGRGREKRGREVRRREKRGRGKKGKWES